MDKARSDLKYYKETAEDWRAIAESREESRSYYRDACYLLRERLEDLQSSITNNDGAKKNASTRSKALASELGFKVVRGGKQLEQGPYVQNL